jgi:hypothetical protein
MIAPASTKSTMKACVQIQNGDTTGETSGRSPLPFRVP